MTPIVTRVDTSRARVSWTSDSVSNTSWVFCDGVLVRGPVNTDSTDRSIILYTPQSATYAWEVIDSDDVPESQIVKPNHTPVISWRSVANAQSYSILVDGEYRKVVRAQTGQDRQSTTLLYRLSEGWHEIEVIATGTNLTTATTEKYGLNVLAPGDPEPVLLITDGSGANLFDIEIP